MATLVTAAHSAWGIWRQEFSLMAAFLSDEDHPNEDDMMHFWEGWNMSSDDATMQHWGGHNASAEEKIQETQQGEVS